MVSDGESRAHPRAKAHIKVEYHFGTTTGIGHTDDISEGGLLLSCDHPAQPGTRVYLRLHLPGSQSADPLKLIGVVTRSVPRTGTDSGPAMAIAFQVAYSRTRDQLHEFMEMLFEGHDRTGVDRLEDGDAPAAYVARFPDVEGHERARTIPPRELDAAFSFTPGTGEVESPRWALIVRVALVVVAVVLVGYLIHRIVQGAP